MPTPIPAEKQDDYDFHVAVREGEIEAESKLQHQAQRADMIRVAQTIYSENRHAQSEVTEVTPAMLIATATELMAYVTGE